MSTEIHCPQCNSTQFTATKGAADTIQMTCIACGHVFTPEEDTVASGFGSRSNFGDQAIISDIQQKGKIYAIKNYRERYNCSLKEAKDKIDAVSGTHGILPANRGGCMGVFLLIVVVIATLIYIF